MQFAFLNRQNWRFGNCESSEKWCWDWYDEKYSLIDKPATGALSAGDYDYRVNRGDSYSSDISNSSVSSRKGGFNSPYHRDTIGLGFRIARTIK